MMLNVDDRPLEIGKFGMELRDPVSCLSHLFAAVWAVFASAILLRITIPDPLRYLTVGIYGASMVYLYSASAAFHAWPLVPRDYPETARVLQVIDRTGIFLLIAGTNTPIMTILLRGRVRQLCLGGMWGLSLLGIIFVWVVRVPPYPVLVLICLGMGLSGMLPLRNYARVLNRTAIAWAILGGVFYAAGAICELMLWPTISTSPFRLSYHEMFHILTVGGSMGFFVFVARYVVRIPESLVLSRTRLEQY